MSSPDARAVAFDPATAEPLPEPPESGTLLVGYTAGARADGWSGEAVLALVRGWNAMGRRVFLCDVAMEDPHLHAALGIDNAEGMSDALRYGTSFKRVANRLSGNLFVATAGTVAVDAGALRRDTRWETFTGGFRDAGALLVLYGPVDGESMRELASRAGTVVVLGVAGETVPGAEIEERIDHHLVHGDPDTAPTADDGEVAASLDWDDPAGTDPIDAGDPLGGDDASAVAELDATEDAAATFDVADLAPDEDFDDPLSDVDADVLSIADPEPGDAEDAGDVAEDVRPDGSHDAFGVSGFDPDEPVTADDDEASEPDADAAPVVDDPVWEVVPDEDAPAIVAEDGDEPMSMDDLAPDPLAASAIDAAPDADAESPLDDGDEASDEFDRVVMAPARDAASGGGRLRTLLVILLLVLVGAFAAAWFGLVEIPGLPIGPSTDGQGELEAAEPSAATAPGVSTETNGAEIGAVPAPGVRAEVAAPVAAYVIALAAYADRESAESARQEWLDRSSGVDVHFLLAPVEVNGRPWFRLLAGPAPDQAAADGMRRTLAGLDGSDGSEWLVREARLAFLLGETRGRAAADQRVSVLRSLGIPAHVLRVPYTDGSEIFRVYAGAYATEAEAGYLRSLLADQDITNAPLVERIGSLSE